MTLEIYYLGYFNAKESQNLTERTGFTQDEKYYKCRSLAVKVITQKHKPTSCESQLGCNKMLMKE